MGPSARPLTRDETRLIVDAFGQRVPPHVGRIVPSPGLSYFAEMAFMNGNPAIMIGNTIYLQKGSPDVTTSDSGIELLLHESTHVILCATLGIDVSGRRYASEWRALGYDADQLYAYRK